MAALTEIRAAGGVVWRRRRSGAIEVCLVHRPAYDDWSLPKGKLKAGEHVLAAAVREVWEETGVRAAPQALLPTSRYDLPAGPKRVDYWSMRVVTADDPPPSEVDKIRWLPVQTALTQLTWPRDAVVLRAFARAEQVVGVVVFVRHATAGRKGSWPGPDVGRPLDEAGAATADDLAPLLALFAPERLVSAPPTRCLRTIEPLAHLVDLPIDVDPAYAEDSERPERVARRLRALAGAAPSTVVSSQGGVIPKVLDVLEGGEHRTPKGTAWVLPFTTAGMLRAFPIALATAPE